MDKASVNYILRLIAQRAIGLLLFVICAKGPFGQREIMYFSLYIGIALLSCLILYLVNPEVLSVRGKTGTDSPLWDKVLLFIFWLTAYYIVYIAAGISYKQMEPDVAFYAGIFLYLISSVISIWAQAVNKFLEPTVRIQDDRKQTVCCRGPYKAVRHPTYAAVLIWCFSVCLIFPHLYVAECALLVAVVICIRTYLEDKMLLEWLDGYAEYAEEVEFRLIPYLW